MRLIIAFIVTLLCIAPLSAQNRVAVEKQFINWLTTDLWPDAQKQGVSARTFNRAFAGISLNWKLPDLVPPGTKAPEKRSQSQAEFRSPGAYFSEKRLRGLAASGRSLLNKHRTLLRQIEKTYGVPGHVIIAIWGRESGFGRAEIPHSAIQVLSTKAFMSTRKALFRKEIIAALIMIEEGTDPAVMKGSWAGAMGQPQFLPSSYLKFAVDFDRDGKRDIWNSVPDSLASIANYLAGSGWQTGRDWGFEVAIPNSVSCAQEGPDRAQPIGSWQAMGISRISGKPFPDHELRGAGMMLVPSGRSGPEFLVTPNFYVIKEYNNSDLYALFIGNLGDRIGFGSQAFRRPWGKIGSMLRSDIAKIQRGLEARGYDVGGADGLPGYKTRRSIGDWQSKSGQSPTCFPNRKMVRRF